MKILSLFDGMACGYEALVRAGIKIDKYYASEIDKYAIQIATKNHPDIIEIGDVNEIDFSQYDVDMVIGGSPCQDLSIAKANRQGLDGARSGLFRKYVEAIRTIKPKYFLLENVSSMSKDAKEVITKELGVEPILINSALVSGQQRKRLYWTNIPGITQPEDKGIMLKDILESGLSWSDKSVCLTANYNGAYFPHDYLRSQRQMVAEPIRIGQIGNGGQGERIYSVKGKSVSLSANGGGGGAKTGLYAVPNLISVGGGEIRIKQATKQGFIEANEGDGISLAYPNSTTRRGRVQKGKSNTLMCGGDSYVLTKYIPQTVRVRKYEVDTEKLKSELRNKKFVGHRSSKEIADELGVPLTKVEHWFRLDDSFAIPDADIWFKLKELLEINTSEFDKSITEFEEKPGTYEKAERKISIEGKMTTLTTGSNDEIYINLPDGEYVIRKLTPIECERLQTLPDNYTEGVSKTQRYKMLGNGWTVDVIAHIFSFMENGSPLKDRSQVK